VAKRLKRLEWTTRFRPVHIQTVLLGATAPERDSEFFYSPIEAFEGEASRYVEIAALENAELSKEQRQQMFQRAGLFGMHVLECPAKESDTAALSGLLATRLPYAITRLRRSVRPKRLALVSSHLDPFVKRLIEELPDCNVITNGGRAFSFDKGESTAAVAALRQALSVATGAA